MCVWCDSSWNHHHHKPRSLSESERDMACCVNYISPPRPPRASLSSFSFSGDAVHSLLREPTLLLRRHSRSPSIVAPRFQVHLFWAPILNAFRRAVDFGSLLQVVAAEKAEPPLKIMISGAPASGKGTQCELITQKVSFFPSYNHITLWVVCI